MTWTEHAPQHFGHRGKLLDLDHYRCFECGITLLIPLRADLAPTPVPGPYAPAPGPPATAETIAAAKRRAAEALALVRQRRTEKT